MQYTYVYQFNGQTQREQCIGKQTNEFRLKNRIFNDRCNEGLVVVNTLEIAWIHPWKKHNSVMLCVFFPAYLAFRLQRVVGEWCRHEIQTMN